MNYVPEHREQANISQFEHPDGTITVQAPLSAIKGWGYRGDEVSPENPKCLAKLETGRHGLLTYYLRWSTRGGPTRLFDPLEDLPDNLTAINTETGRPYFQFMAVTSEAFQHYLSYLKTDNPSFLLLAERAA